MAEPTEDHEDKQAHLKEVIPNDNKIRESITTTMAFFVFGFLIYFVYSLIIAGAQDILAGTFVQTSVVLVCNIGPYFAVTLIAPYYIQKVQYVYRVIAIFIFEVAGLLMVVVAKDIGVKLFGVCLSSLGFGLGELSFIAMSSYYHEVVVSSFSAGTGAGISLAPLYYTAMTTWACIPPGATVLVVAVLMVLILIFYSVMDRKHSTSSPEKLNNSRKDIAYKKLENEAEDASQTANQTEADISTQAHSDKSDEHTALTWREKLTAIKQILPIAGSVAIAWVAEYLIIQAILTTIAFRNAPFPPRDHYQYYIFTFLGGELFGRSYLVVAASFKPEWGSKLVIRRLWILAVVEWAHLAFFCLVAWYRFINTVSLVLLFSFTAGVIIGIMYNNMLALYSEISDPKVREFTLGYASVATGTGAFTAGLLGLVVEPWLRNHCLKVAISTDYCLTRPINRTVNACANRLKL